MKYKVNGVGRRRLDGAKSGQSSTEAQSQQICPKIQMIIVHGGENNQNNRQCSASNFPESAAFENA